MALEAQNNPFTSILMVEDDPEDLPDANPASGQRRLAVGTDHLLYLVDDAGTKTQVGGAAGAVATDAIWDAKGDLAVGTGSNTAQKLTVGANGLSPIAASGETTGIKWGVVPGTLLGAMKYSKGADTAWASSSSSTDADIDATNGILAITVPASGSFLAMISLDWTFGTANTGGYITLRQGSTQLGSAACISGNVASSGIGGVAVSAGHFVGYYPVTGQTPGAMTLKAGFLRIGTTVLNVYAHDATGAAGHLASPFVMAAWAL